MLNFLKKALGLNTDPPVTSPETPLQKLVAKATEPSKMQKALEIGIEKEYNELIKRLESGRYSGENLFMSEGLVKRLKSEGVQVSCVIGNLYSIRT